MATFHGNSGVAKVGANTVAEVRSFSVTETMETADDTSMGDSYRSFKAGHGSWSATIECLWDDTDSNGQEAMAIGESITLNLYPEGAGSGADQIQGTAIVTEVGVAVASEDIVTRSISLQGSGGITHGTA
tara:strand:- start:1018 stop:1407 length:390 start_codon:yes stop_codon:yes gene_type:complete